MPTLLASLPRTVVVYLGADAKATLLHYYSRTEAQHCSCRRLFTKSCGSTEWAYTRQDRGRDIVVKCQEQDLNYFMPLVRHLSNKKSSLVVHLSDVNDWICLYEKPQECFTFLIASNPLFS